MNVVRSLERRLERLLDGVAGRMFGGRLHLSEVAGKLARELDFARFEHDTGPATANYAKVMIHPNDLMADPVEAQELLASELFDYTVEQGLRLEGPFRVKIEPSPEVTPGNAVCHVEVEPGPITPWARLVGRGEPVEVGPTRALIGRSEQSDVHLPYDDVSRRHALLWRQDGKVWLRDLGSANGTFVEGVRLGDDPLEVQRGAMVAFSDHRYRFVEI